MHGSQENTRRTKRKSGFTLVEVMIASVTLVIVSGGLYFGATQAIQLTRMTLLCTQARSLGVQRMEELVSLGKDGIIAQQQNFVTQTNWVQGPYMVVRNVDIVGHAQNRSVVSNLADALYLEVHVDMTYKHPRATNWVTDSFSTLVM